MDAQTGWFLYTLLNLCLQKGGGGIFCLQGIIILINRTVVVLWYTFKITLTIQCMPIIFMTHRSISVNLSSHIGNLWHVQGNLHQSWLTDRCNWHRLWPSFQILIIVSYAVESDYSQYINGSVLTFYSLENYSMWLQKVLVTQTTSRTTTSDKKIPLKENYLLFLSRISYC